MKYGKKTVKPNLKYVLQTNECMPVQQGAPQMTTEMSQRPPSKLLCESPVRKEDNAQARGHKEALANYDKDFFVPVCIQTRHNICIVLKFIFVMPFFPSVFQYVYNIAIRIVFLN